MLSRLRFPVVIFLSILLAPSAAYAKKQETGFLDRHRRRPRHATNTSLVPEKWSPSRMADDFVLHAPANRR